MKYMGGKVKIAPDIIPILNKVIDKDTLYVEPFVGGGAIAFNVDASSHNIYINDANKFMASFYRQIANG